MPGDRRSHEFRLAASLDPKIPSQELTGLLEQVRHLFVNERY